MATKKTTKKSAKESAKVREGKSGAGRGSAVAADRKLSALDAASRVLGETKQPMSCVELIETMAAKGYWSSPAGKTPQATLYAAIQREIAVKKDQSRFKKSAPGRFSLT
jgi:hypothetical protein